MFTKFIDLDNEILINHAARLIENVQGSEQIYKIYIHTKNSITYVPDNVLQKASETLVMGRGNNFSKNVLLYSLLKINGFECELKYKYVIDNTKIIACKNNINTPWFYVYVNYLGRKFDLDCSLDGSFQRVIGVTFDGDETNCSVEKYLLNKERAFTVLDETELSSQEAVLKALERKGTAQIYSRARGIGYV